MTLFRHKKLSISHGLNKRGMPCSMLLLGCNEIAIYKSVTISMKYTEICNI